VCVCVCVCVKTIVVYDTIYLINHIPSHHLTTRGPFGTAHNTRPIRYRSQHATHSVPLTTRGPFGTAHNTRPIRYRSQHAAHSVPLTTHLQCSNQSTCESAITLNAVLITPTSILRLAAMINGTARRAKNPIITSGSNW
jgi:hypothetical protein